MKGEPVCRDMEEIYRIRIQFPGGRTKLKLCLNAKEDGKKTFEKSKLDMEVIYE